MSSKAVDGYQGHADLTVGVDLGGPSKVSRVRWTVHHTELLDQVLEFSDDDGATFATATESGPTLLGTSGNWRTYEATDLIAGTFTHVRLSVRDTQFSTLHSDARVGALAIFNGLTAYVFGSVPALQPVLTGTQATLAFALSADGSTPNGEWLRYGVFGLVDELPEIGGQTDMLGGDWPVEAVNGPDFSLLVRRPTNTDEDAALVRLLDSVAVDVYFNPSEGSLISMSERPANLQKSVWGLEATPGAGGTPVIRLKSFRAMIQPDNEDKEYIYQGDLIPGDTAIISEASEAPLENGYPTFDEMGVPLSSVVQKPVTSTLAAGVYRHEFRLNVRGVADPQTFICQYGDENGAEQVKFGHVPEFGISVQGRKETSISGKLVAQNIEPQNALAVGNNSKFTVSLTGAPTSGNLRIRVMGDETADVAVATLSNTNWRTALEALSTVGTGNVTVTNVGSVYTFEFVGDLAGQQIPMIELTKKQLVGGTSPDAVVAMTASGGYSEYDCVPITPGMYNFYYAPSRATLAANKLTKLFSAALNWGNRFGKVWYVNTDNASWKRTVETLMSFMATVKIASDSIAAQMVTDAKARTRKYARFEAIGPEIGASGINRSFTVDLATKVKHLGNISVEDEIIAREFQLNANFDPAWNQAATIVLINDVPSYT